MGKEEKEAGRKRDRKCLMQIENKEVEDRV